MFGAVPFCRTFSVRLRILTGFFDDGVRLCIRCSRSPGGRELVELIRGVDVSLELELDEVALDCMAFFFAVAPFLICWLCCLACLELDGVPCWLLLEPDEVALDCLAFFFAVAPFSICSILLLHAILKMGMTPLSRMTGRWNACLSSGFSLIKRNKSLTFAPSLMFSSTVFATVCNTAVRATGAEPAILRFPLQLFMSIDTLFTFRVSLARLDRSAMMLYVNHTHVSLVYVNGVTI